MVVSSTGITSSTFIINLNRTKYVNEYKYREHKLEACKVTTKCMTK